MTDWIKCTDPGCRLIYDPARFGPHPLHARLEARESAYLDDLKSRRERGEPLKLDEREAADVR